MTIQFKRIYFQMLPYLHSAARKIVSDYRSAVKGKHKDAPRWHRCTHALGFNNYNAHAVAIPSAAMFIRYEGAFQGGGKVGMCICLERCTNSFFKIDQIFM